MAGGLRPHHLPPFGLRGELGIHKLWLHLGDPRRQVLQQGRRQRLVKSNLEVVRSRGGGYVHGTVTEHDVPAREEDGGKRGERKKSGQIWRRRRLARASIDPLSEVVDVVDAQNDLGPAENVRASVRHANGKVPDEARVDSRGSLREVRHALLEAVQDLPVLAVSHKKLAVPALAPVHLRDEREGGVEEGRQLDRPTRKIPPFQPPFAPGPRRLTSASSICPFTTTENAVGSSSLSAIATAWE